MCYDVNDFSDAIGNNSTVLQIADGTQLLYLKTIKKLETYDWKILMTLKSM